MIEVMQMKKTDLFFDLQCSFKRDALTDFINELSFIPHDFGHQCNDPDAVCEERITGDFELIYIIGGESIITIKHREYICKAGDMILIPPFTLHKIETPPSNPHDNYWLHFEVTPIYRQEDFTSNMLRSDENRIKIGLREELLSLYKSFEFEKRCIKPGNMAICSNILAHIIILLLRHNNSQSYCENTAQYKNSQDTLIVNKGLEFIRNSIYTKIKIIDICNYLHVSESYLYKVFHRVLKISPNNLIVLYKIKQAERIMKTNLHSFNEISEMLGFSSQYYFSAVFKRYYKMSPSEYMNLI
jgi:AraC-like DNA-binding protein